MLPLGLHPVYLAGLVVLGLGILFHIIGLATPAWSVFDNGLIDKTLGLFRACLNGNCFNYEGTGFITIICAIVWAAAVKDDTDDIGYSCVLSIIGGILISVGGWVLYISVRRTIGYANVP
ncbi:unnamed protein product [Candidula unifasciata]|uniref:Uncharacterized protein n=1 Tax=Candidula unifasciata TaxID=100452 RepID=A0A8S3YY45_9EUPU|nr:unnamed protein product [Candidula unifasciata]